MSGVQITSLSVALEGVGILDHLGHLGRARQHLDGEPLQQRRELGRLLRVRRGDDDAPGIPRGTGKTIDGEVIVSSEYAAKLAPEFGWEPLEELTLYIVHGLLHLCGYDDLTEAALPVMRQREREVLALIGLQQPFAPRPSPLSLSEGSEA